MSVFVSLIIEVLISAAVVGYETQAHPLDPIYNTCATKTDPEYGHYEDRDGDGVVCE